MHLFIFGAGSIGACAAHYAEKLNYNVTLFDVNQENLDKVNNQWVRKELLPSDWTLDSCLNNDICQGVISCLPASLNVALARSCIKNLVPYFDLGGINKISEEIENISRENKYKSVVVTDLGLSPGTSEILASKMYREFGEIPQTLDIFVGGIPSEQLDKVGYFRSWSKVGLSNNYKDNCKILNNGKFEEIAALSNYIELDLFNLRLEAFTTSCGAPHILDLLQRSGVKNHQYRTIRYREHHSKVLEGLRNNILDELLDKSSEKHSTIPDMVLIHIRAASKNKEFSKTWRIEAKKPFTAMQISTSAGILAAADTFLKMVPARQGFIGSPIQFLAESPRFWATLEKLGVKV